MAELLYPRESHKIMGACFAVYREKGCGFTEPIYQECMEIELECQGIPFEPQEQLTLAYRGRQLRQKFIPDLVCYGSIIVELKAVSELTEEHEAQVLNYLNATGMKLGILVNFGHYSKVEYRRIALSLGKGRPQAPARPRRPTSRQRTS
ncbi:MAG TPA: GxxExxY protein [Planctomycetota bacterium]|nr:GxxExxY protein [Planctomycetota bacterium]HRR81222.1 GxxExxY protein [Planctomycetota bacterium]HRT93547.1 GxxExxY protein [Planctomycetota bacterium]